MRLIFRKESDVLKRHLSTLEKDCCTLKKIYSEKEPYVCVLYTICVSLT